MPAKNGTMDTQSGKGPMNPIIADPAISMMNKPVLLFGNLPQN